MSNTGSMTVATHPNGIAPVPDGRYRFGAKGGISAQAWQTAWDMLKRTAWTNGAELAEKVAEQHGLKTSSVAELLSRMRASGTIERKMIPVETTYQRGGGYTANRPRVHYRIARKYRAILVDQEMTAEEAAQDDR